MDKLKITDLSVGDWVSDKHGNCAKILGIENWSDGLVFEQVCADLENEGYEVQPYLIPACAVDAPHRRDRVWFVAHRSNAGSEVLQREGAIGFCADSSTSNANHKRQHELLNPPVANKEGQSFRSVSSGDVTNTEVAGRGVLQDESRTQRPRMRNELPRIERAIPNLERFPTQPPVCGRDDGLSSRLDACPVPGWKQPNGRWRMSGYWRRESIKAYGNAVVPQVVLRIFETINEYENN